MLLYLILSTVVTNAWSLTCYCGGESRFCTGDIDVCVNPTDVCFVTILITTPTSNPTYEYACRETVNEGFTSIWQGCLDGPIVQDFASMQCCNNEDLCNRRLNPPLPRKYVNITTAADQNSATTPVTLITTIKLPDTGMDDRSNQIYIGLTIAIPIFSFILIIVMITAAIFYLFKKSLSNVRQILKQTILDCFRSGCCNNRPGAEPLYDVPDYYTVPPLPPRNEKPTTERDAAEQTYCEIHDDDGNQDECLRQQCECDPINDGIFHDPSIHIPNLEANRVVNCTEPVHLHVDSEIMSGETDIPEMQQNSSYIPSTNVSDLAVNPAYGTNVAIAPEILTEQNEAYEVRNSGMDNH